MAWGADGLQVVVPVLPALGLAHDMVNLGGLGQPAFSLAWLAQVLVPCHDLIP